jgi:hypothetical protein
MSSQLICGTYTCPIASAEVWRTSSRGIRLSCIAGLTGPGLGFGSFWTARRTLAGYEAMAMIRKGQVCNIGGRDIKAQTEFIAGLFQLTA